MYPLVAQTASLPLAVVSVCGTYCSSNGCMTSNVPGLSWPSLPNPTQPKSLPAACSTDFSTSRLCSIRRNSTSCRLSRLLRSSCFSCRRHPAAMWSHPWPRGTCLLTWGLPQRYSTGGCSQMRQNPRCGLVKPRWHSPTCLISAAPPNLPARIFEEAVCAGVLRVIAGHCSPAGLDIGL
ncbi:MAG: hypothetical protein ACI9DC_003234 [Gammaproteobacteria bacterium]|jgi:hypothetical protein